jgi:hypothetical protein
VRSSAATKSYEVLWLGDPASVPAPAWQIRRGLAFAVSENGLPDGRRLWPSADPGVGNAVETSLTKAVAGLTVRLGSELARAGIRYVVMPDGIAPSLPGVQLPPSVPPPASLVQALQAQSDLRQLPTEGGVIAFENVAWPAPGATTASSVVALSTSRAPSSTSRQLGLAAGLLVVGLGIGEGFVRRRRRRQRGGGVPPQDSAAPGSLFRPGSEPDSELAPSRDQEPAPSALL